MYMHKYIYINATSKKRDGIVQRNKEKAEIHLLYNGSNTADEIPAFLFQGKIATF